MANYHVTRNGNGSWNYRKENSQRATGITNTQSEAERLAKIIVHNQGGGEVVIHGENGRIRDKDTVKPGNDPYPPKDTKF